MEEGNYRGAVRLLCSEDAIAEHSNDTLETLRLKHPPCSSTMEDLDPCNAPLRFPINTEDVKKAIMSFPNGSGGALMASFLNILRISLVCLLGMGVCSSLLKALVQLITLILEGRTPRPFAPYCLVPHSLLSGKGGWHPSNCYRLYHQKTCFQIKHMSACMRRNLVQIS